MAERIELESVVDKFRSAGCRKFALIIIIMIIIIMKSRPVSPQSGSSPGR